MSVTNPDTDMTQRNVDEYDKRKLIINFEYRRDLS